MPTGHVFTLNFTLTRHIQMKQAQAGEEDKKHQTICASGKNLLQQTCVNLLNHKRSTHLMIKVVYG